MSDLPPLLREAADALWLIPIHAGLAQRLTNAAERTRPSEAEVEAAWKKAYADIGAGEVDFPPNQWARAFAAALSTPPLPSAEPVAWKVEESLDGRVYNTFWFGDDPERAERIRARMDSLGVKMTPLYPTPPAAAQDTARLDWLEHNERHIEHIGREAHGEKWRASFAFTIHGDVWAHGETVRAAIDNAMDAGNREIGA